MTAEGLGGNRVHEDTVREDRVHENNVHEDSNRNGGHQADDGALFAAPVAPTPSPTGSTGTPARTTPGMASRPAARQDMVAVARVCIESALPHLDRPFDYAIPRKLADTVRLGTRVRVRFAGRLINAVVVEVADSSEFTGTLVPLNSAAAAPSYTADALELARGIARRYGGSLWDVLRLMAPPRVSSVESRDWSGQEFAGSSYAEAAAFLSEAAADAGFDVTAVAAGARVVWEAMPQALAPASVPASALLAPSVAVAAKGLTAVVVVPDARAVARLEAALTAAGLSRWTARSGGHYVVLDHDDGAAARYSAYLAALHGQVGIVLGTRTSVMQPVPDLGLITVWDDSSTVYEEPHAPYPHARTIAAMRAEFNGAGALFGSYTPGVDAMALVAHGWAEHHSLDRARARAATPTIDVLTAARREAEGGAGWHWMPGSAWRSVTKALGAPGRTTGGPVGIVVPRTGYVKAVTCAECGTWAQCRTCEGSLSQANANAALVCVDCGSEQADWHCSECHSPHVKQARQGVERIAEQVKAMAKGTVVTVSAAAGGTIADDVVTEGIVVATPGALPAVPGGYAHVVVVGADVPANGGLGAELQAIRWWLTTAALVRSRGNGGGVTLVGDLPDSVRQAIVSWTPGDAARDAYTERASLGLPPARRTLAIAGADPAITLALSVTVEGERIERHPDITVVPSRDGVTLLMSRRVTADTVDAVRAVQLELSKSGDGELRLRVDGPLEV
jgi:primosomal protein N' (replication factor Y)